MAGFRTVLDIMPCPIIMKAGLPGVFFLRGCDTVRDERKYCMCCGEDVPVNPVNRAGRVELTCINCGFTLDVLSPAEAPRPARCIMIVDDSG
jgi:hypothetical protein